MNRRTLLAHVGVGALGSTPALGRRTARGRPDGRDRASGARGRTGTSANAQDEQSETYRNPVHDRIFPDPDVLGVDGTYYAYATYHPWTEGRGPDRELIPVLRSPNLVNWKPVGPAFAENPDWSRYRGLWAPGVGRLGGPTLLYYSDSEFGASNPGIGVATASDPEGPFEPRGGLFRSEGIGVPNSIDPALFVREGTPYLFWGSHGGIYGIRLAEDGLSTAVNASETFQIAGGGVEAPYVVEREGYFYFFGSRGTCCRGANSSYHVVAGRAEGLRGPYRNRAGERLTADGATGTTILEGDDRFLGPGHCAAVRDERGGWWLLYHAYVRGNPWVGDTPRRVLMLDRIRWEDGWPVVGENGTPSAEGRVPPVSE
ncbi:family 43 glycosylhydrolase [Halorussus salinisoli]|uniref:family 43 glycosylhydrolase n=1 Tax=Halorussus salinisoli TaxID=2558242 RepID=UPI001484F32E|nr:family 43 glycosylhydrolase [Halorussus salinisoli]